MHDVCCVYELGAYSIISGACTYVRIYVLYQSDSSCVGVFQVFSVLYVCVCSVHMFVCCVHFNKCCTHQCLYL